MASFACTIVFAFFLLLLIIRPVVAPFSRTPSPTASSPSTSVSPSATADLSTLLSIKASIDSTGLTPTLSSWNPSSFFCYWPGITCNHSTWDVLEFKLPFQNLSGELPSSLGRLKSLQTLDLLLNYLSGELPSTLGQMESLQILFLSGNRLSGELPSSFGRLKSLQTLDLSNNQLSGELSSTLGRLKGLRTLDLSDNQFSGELPSTLGQMKSLQILFLSGNRLSGELPSSLGQMESLLILGLSGNQLSGELPSSLGQLKSLRNVDLSGNQLSGELPISILGQIKSLESLYLSGNQLSGELPSTLGRLKGLQTLDLSDNQLSGELPSTLGQMESLQFLNLSRNQLSGELPSSLGWMKRLANLDLSYNRLQGSIPLQVYQKYSSNSFLGNPGLRAPYPDHYHLDGNIHPHRNHAKRITILVVVCAVGLASLLAGLCAYRWYGFRKKDHGLDFVAPQYKAWTAEEMRVATNNFDADNIIGSGATSVCYLGSMKSPSPQGMTRVVALKRLKVDDDEDGGDEARKSFVNECKTLCKLRHRNLVKVVGYCVEGRANFALVMEYMEGGDLERCLHMQQDDEARRGSISHKLGWEERVDVALNVAEGLVYLHHKYEQPIIHCDIKPKNILLGADMVAKISDFGIARLVEGKERGDISISKFRGSFGYIAPEYGMGLRISTKVDVYSYGMLLLELVTGVKPTSLMLENKAMNLRTWCETLQASSRLTDVLQDYDLATLQEAKLLLRLGVQCTHDVAKERPTMYIVRDCILQLRKARVQNEPSSLPEINHQLNN